MPHEGQAVAPLFTPFPSSSGGGAPANAEYLVLTAHADLSNERILEAGNGLMFSDLGAGRRSLDIVTGAASGIRLSADSIEIDPSYIALWTSKHTFNAGVAATSGAFTQGVQIQGNLLVKDSYAHIAHGYETLAARPAGLVVNFMPRPTNTSVGLGGFTPGSAGVSNPKVVTVGSDIFSPAGMLIQIQGANNQQNNGLFEVLAHTGTTLVIRGVGTTDTVEGFTQRNFVADPVAAGSIRHVVVSSLRAGTNGEWEVGVGDMTGITFNDLYRVGGPNTVALNDGGTGATSAVGARTNLGAAAATTVITAGAGLTGGGDLLADRTLAVGAGTGISVAADTVAVDQTFAPTWSGLHTFNAAITMGNSRILQSQGANVAVSEDLTLGTNGNIFVVTGQGSISAIATTNWQDGSIISLIFTGTVTVKHNMSAGTAGTAPILLASSANFSGISGNTLTLVLSKVTSTAAWREIARAQ